MRVLHGLKKPSTDKFLCLPMEFGEVSTGFFENPETPALLLMPVPTLAGLHSLGLLYLCSCCPPHQQDLFQDHRKN